MEQALDLCAKGGQVVMLAIAWEPTAVLPPNWMAREVRMQSSFGTQPHDWRHRAGPDAQGTGLESITCSVATNFVPIEGIQEASRPSAVRPPSCRWWWNSRREQAITLIPFRGVWNW